jgi:hypothetical protein
MFFAPVMSRNTFVSPRAADLALQRFCRKPWALQAPYNARFKSAAMTNSRP